MTFCKRLAVTLMCLAALLSLFGCKTKEKFILDGPGMENTLVWDSFSISRFADSYAQHNFHITVQYHDDGYIVTGTVLDDDGTEYTEEEGIVLPQEACQALDNLKPHLMPDIRQTDTDTDTDSEAPVALDMYQVEILVTSVDGTQRSKVDENDFSICVYQIVLPYFREKHN